ncbi:hypothetical protein JG688_00011192 [Phytophthora aleatoria]|uniref:Uncharacterized protein n=1 Tax=Phytophthora aleatoria TaxID=2496075 RepID=A0A8J5IN32_9STRA|nr:hypothetical protein JG688_00011192 [Phytophthora aleatoria]
MEEEAVDFFSRVSDYCEFVSGTRPSSNMCGTLKLCCLSSERRDGARANRFTGIDVFKRAELKRADGLDADWKPEVTQVMVWDDTPMTGVKAGADFQVQRTQLGAMCTSSVRKYKATPILKLVRKYKAEWYVKFV